MADQRIRAVERPGNYRPKSPVPAGIEAEGTVWLSGLVAANLDTGQLSTGDIVEQTHLTFDYIEKTLANAGCALENVVRTWVYLTCQADFDGMDETYRSRFAGHYPARSTLIVAALRHPQLRIEIDVIALKPEA